MAYYLSEQRDEDVVGAYYRYQDYLRKHESQFPPGAFALATAEWYYYPNDHRCPHDGWLEHFTISEPSSGEHHDTRSTSAEIRLLAAYHDGFIEFRYADVFGYSISVSGAGRGHGDWRYDEFRLSDNGRLIHEIEWARGATWIIEAADVEFLWTPASSNQAGNAADPERA